MHNYKRYQKKKKKNYTSFKIFLALIILVLFFFRYLYGNIKLPNNEVIVKKGDTVSSVIKQNLSKKDQFFFKIYTKINPVTNKIYPGTHQFSGTNISKTDFLENLTSKPAIDYIKFTVLEGRSIYDIDDSLTNKGLISAEEYISAVSGNENISKLKQTYTFLNNSEITKANTLEGFLMPDTYHLRTNKVVSDLIKLQLQNFDTKIRTPYQNTIKNHTLDLYQLITLASIVEKEEKNPKNKATVAGILINRIQKRMLLGADITLCYNFKKPYEYCTKKLINEKIYDKTNPYNTRKNRGLPPTAIGNPSMGTILATINYNKTKYFYYLHNIKTGKIYYGKTLQQHNANLKYM